MATYNKFNSWAEVSEEVANCGTDQFVVALTNSAPSASNTVLSDITQITYTNLSGRNLTTSGSSQTSGTYSLAFSDLTLTASGSVGPFRYVVIYDDTPTSPADPLVCCYDYGSSITLATSETFVIDFGSSLYTKA
jgi:hypothetical protein